MATKSPQKTTRLRRAISMNKAEDICKEEFKKTEKLKPDMTEIPYGISSIL
jgi:hypothetical protein